MTDTMVRSAMLTVLVQIFLLSHSAQVVEPEVAPTLPSGAVDLPWQDELCCDSPATPVHAEDSGPLRPGTHGPESDLPPRPRCDFRSSTAESHPLESSGGTCLDILCRMEENWENVTCELQCHHTSSTRSGAGLVAVSLRRLVSDTANTEPNNEPSTSDNPVICEAEDSFMCSLAVDPTTSFVTVVTVSISNSTSSPVLLRIPARPMKPSPPVNLSHLQTIEAELILHWDDPPHSGPLTYQVRFSSNTSHPDWQVVYAPGERRLALDLTPRLNYTIQVRSSTLSKPPLWSDWSDPHHIHLQTVSYIPDKVVARPGENVTVYCVFNDHNINASAAMWRLNFHEPLHHSHPVNQWVSQITVRTSEIHIYELLRCTQGWSIPYSQIYVEGASINITCETNGDIDAMDCRWNDTVLTKLIFRSSWADLSCDVMERREKAEGRELGELGPPCKQVRSKEKVCTIHPLRMNCYKLWLEAPSLLGPIRSKPIYLSAIDHVKPYRVTNVQAVSRSSGVLRVTWDPPRLPVGGLQCQFRYHSQPYVKTQPEWRLQSSVPVPWAEVAVSDMCKVYVVQVRCMHISGNGYWSEWSDPVHSTPQNSRAPERGPDFWRILQDDPYRNQTNVTLLFERLQVSEQSYCMEGFIVQHQTPGGSVVREQIGMASTYSFEWNQQLQVVTVEAYNSLGSSANNYNMTLERQPRRRSVNSFSVKAINSSCVSLSWTLLDNSSVPLFMVVQWSLQRQSGDTWARLPYTERPVYLRGDLSGSEEGGFFLYPVFADGEGEPMHTKASRGDPAAYVMLMIISFLFIVLFVTLVLSQNQMKKFVWKDVPDPNKCSWAKGLDFKKAETLDHLFRPPEGLPTWLLLPPSENISKVVITDKVDLSALTTALVQAPLVSLTPDPTVLSMSPPPAFDPQVDHPMSSKVLLGGGPFFALDLDALTDSSSRIDQLHLIDQPPDSTDTSGQSSVTYATVLISGPKQEQHPIHLHDKDGSGSSSSDEGNFSANNSDISGSFPGGLWDLDDPRRSCSYNSVEELSETSERGDEEEEEEEEVREEKDLYYLGLDYPAEDEESDEDEVTEIELLKNVVLNREVCSAESYPLLGGEDLNGSNELLSMQSLSPPYLPQFRTVQCTRQPEDNYV